MKTVAASAAAAIICALALSPIVGAAPATAASSSSPARVALIVPITVSVRDSGIIESELLENYTSEFGLLTRTLDQVIDRPVTLAIDPAIIASIRILGDKAPESSIAWLDRLAQASNETFPLLWADTDVTAPLHAGATAVLAPESFDFAIDPANFSTEIAQPAPSAAPSSTATSEPDAGPPPLPTTETLTEWNYTISSISWPALNSVVADDLGPLSTAFETTLLSSTNVSGLAVGDAHALIDESDVLVIDEPLSSEFTATVASRSGADWESAMAVFEQKVTNIDQSDDTKATIIALDRTAAASDIDLAATISQLEQNAAITPIGLSAVLAEPAESAKLVDHDQDESRIATVKSLLTLETKDRAFASIAQDPTLITAERRLDVLAALTNQSRDDDSRFDAAAAIFTTDSVALRGSVSIVDSSAITLLADRASLPVTVSNTLDQPVTVLITVRPQTPLLTVEDSLVSVTVEPHSQRKGQVPVQSLSNGVVQLTVSLHGTSGVSIGDTAFVETHVQAGWETPVTLGLGVLVVLIFIAGIVRTVVRRRRARMIEA